MTADRIKRVEEEIKREISIILQDKINDPEIPAITITRVEVTRDLNLAKVFYESPMDEKAKSNVAKALKRASGFLRREVAEKILIKRVPVISFREDVVEEREKTIDNIFEKIEKERRERTSE